MNLLEEIDRIERHYSTHHEIEGMAFIINKPGRGAPAASDNDTALITGLRLAAAAHRYACEPDHASLERVTAALAGVRLLLTVSPVPGVLARWAYPTANAWEEIGYDPVKSLEGDGGNTFGQRIRESLMYESLDGKYAYETRTTKDQLSGVLLGLVSVLRFCPTLQDEVRLLITVFLRRMIRTKWSLEDHTGRTLTSAHKLDQPLRLIVMSASSASLLKGRYQERVWWFHFVWLMTMHYNRVIQNVYSHALNAYDCYSLHLLRKHHRHETGVRCWWSRIYAQMRKDDNPLFASINHGITGQPMSMDATLHFEAGIQKQYHDGFRWSRDPAKWWSPEDAPSFGPSIDSMLPYWINQVAKKGLA